MKNLAKPIKSSIKLSGCVFALLISGQTLAATITVDNSTCTLSDAITSANTDTATGGCTAGSGDDTIVFAPALSGQTITLAAALPNIASNLTIDGSALASHVKISGNATYRVFYIASGTVTLNHLDIINGKAIGSGIAGSGAAILQLPGGTLTLNNSVISGHSVGSGTIYSGGTLTINGCTISNNSSSTAGAVLSFNPLTVTSSTFSNNSGQGAAIDAQGNISVSNSTFLNNSTGGALSGGAIALLGGTGSTVSNSTFSGNSANNGGAIYTTKPLTVNNSTFSNNTATYSVTSSGGGILSVNPLVVSNSTFSGNSTTAKGGGIAGLGATTTVSNSTFSNNSTSGTGSQGGGIFNNTAKTLTVNNSTFSGNSASTANGGAISNLGTLNLTNSILANSTGGGDCVNTGGTIASALNNLIKDSSYNCGLNNGVNGNIIGSDPLFGSLAINGGTTQTFALLVGSPAINAGDSATCISTDQRGKTRSGICDIGAFEYIPPLAAPIDFSFSSKAPQTFATEIQIK